MHYHTNGINQKVKFLVVLRQKIFMAKTYYNLVVKTWRTNTIWSCNLTPIGNLWDLPWYLRHLGRSRIKEKMFSSIQIFYRHMICFLILRYNRAKKFLSRYKNYPAHSISQWSNKVLMLIMIPCTWNIEVINIMPKLHKLHFLWNQEKSWRFKHCVQEKWSRFIKFNKYIQNRLNVG